MGDTLDLTRADRAPVPIFGDYNTNTKEGFWAVDNDLVWDKLMRPGLILASTFLAKSQSHPWYVTQPAILTVITDTVLI